MIHFTEAQEIALLDTMVGKTAEQLNEGLHKKRFRASDTSLSYRQVNSLSVELVIKDDRPNPKKGWRYFSLHDIIFFKVLEKCRELGLDNAQIKDLRDCFYHEIPDKAMRVNSNKLHSEMAIKAVMAGAKVSLILTPNESYKAYFFDLGSEPLINMMHDFYIYINFNHIVDNALKLAMGKHKPELPDYRDWSDLLIELSQSALTPKEKEVIDIIRQKDYTKVTIKKKGETLNVYGESVKDASDLTAEQLVKVMSEKNYSNIEIQKRDGKIVSYKQEDVYKI
jgi:DNA-binding transcriptional MerR regulator